MEENRSFDDDDLIKCFLFIAVTAVRAVTTIPSSSKKLGSTTTLQLNRPAQRNAVGQTANGSVVVGSPLARNAMQSKESSHHTLKARLAESCAMAGSAEGAPG